MALPRTPRARVGRNTEAKEAALKARVILSEMTREQIRKVAPETTVVLPTASIEQHGPHLPVQTDTLACETICRRAAELASAEVSVTVAPTLCYGISAHHFPYPGVLTLTPDTFMTVLREVCDSLARSGFKRIVIVNGHGGNDESVRLVARDLANTMPVSFAAASYWNVGRESLEREADASAIGPVPGHAGGFETSLVLALRPDLVDGRPPAAGGPPKRSAGSPVMVARGGHRIGDGPGTSDDASLASAEHGQRFIDIIARDLASFLVQFSKG